MAENWRVGWRCCRRSYLRSVEVPGNFLSAMTQDFDFVALYLTPSDSAHTIYHTMTIWVLLFPFLGVWWDRSLMPTLALWLMKKKDNKRSPLLLHQKGLHFFLRFCLYYFLFYCLFLPPDFYPTQEKDQKVRKLRRDRVSNIAFPVLLLVEADVTSDKTVSCARQCYPCPWESLTVTVKKHFTWEWRHLRMMTQMTVRWLPLVGSSSVLFPLSANNYVATSFLPNPFVKEPNCNNATII